MFFIVSIFWIPILLIFFYIFGSFVYHRLILKTSPSKNTGMPDKLLYTDAKQRLNIILIYRKSLGKLSPYGLANESDLPYPKKLIKIALIEELMCPRQLIEGTHEENIKFLEDCLFMLDSFVTTGDFETNKEFLQKTNYNSIEKFMETQNHILIKNTNSMTLIKILDEFRKGNREKALLDQLYKFIMEAKQE